jgi:transposase
MTKNHRTTPAKHVTTKAPAEQSVKHVLRATRAVHSSGEMTQTVWSCLLSEDRSVDLCREEGTAQSLWCSLAKELREAGRKRLAGDTAR